MKHLLLCILLLPMLVGCGGDESPSSTTSSAPVAQTLGDNKGDRQEAPVAGSMSFTVDGDTLTLPTVAAGHAFYTSVASQITFRASSDSVEEMTLNIMNADLKALEYPVTLPQPRPVNITVATRGATVGFAYANPESQAWTTGSAKVTLESFGTDGLLKGSFHDVVLRAVEAGQPDITVSDGHFSIQLTSPW